MDGTTQDASLEHLMAQFRDLHVEPTSPPGSLPSLPIAATTSGFSSPSKNFSFHDWKGYLIVCSALWLWHLLLLALCRPTWMYSSSKDNPEERSFSWKRYLGFSLLFSIMFVSGGWGLYTYGSRLWSA